jgi:hypothetical protein
VDVGGSDLKVWMQEVLMKKDGGFRNLGEGLPIYELYRPLIHSYDSQG